MDLADGSLFVDGVAQYDEAAKQAGVFVLTGASSYPALSIAVIRRLTEGMKTVSSIRAGIAPSPFASVGRNVVRSIAGYAGEKLSLTIGGEDKTLYPMTSTMRYTIAPPGRLPMGSRLFALYDVPDMRILPRLYPDTKDIWIGAAPEPEILHRGLIFLAWLRRLRLFPRVSKLTGLMAWASKTFRWGEHRGGMFVAVTGEDEAGKPVARSWHMIDESADDPYIPSMAISALVRRLLNGETIPPGARAASGDVTLEDYMKEFALKTIHTGIRDDGPAYHAPLYKRILNAAWDDLPEQVRTMHDIGASARAEGTGSVECGEGLLSRIICRVFDFPPSGREIPVSVDFTVEDGVETWTRNFAGHEFSSLQCAGRGRGDRLITEKFGIFSFDMALTVEDGRMYYVMRRWRKLGIPLPKMFAPRTDAYETVNEEWAIRLQRASVAPTDRPDHPLQGETKAYHLRLQGIDI